ncbi:unnamed protein product [Adineta ricciae]|uniref:Uncharacterized protein n=1 Tax=Adineta ricciae TaxID=249248 RepID=A0A813Z128_ADIRI|nr:unnamed protein product [Adineta ricciae]
MTESSDDIIILSDDDVQIESEIKPKQTKLISDKTAPTRSTNSTTNTTTRRRTPILILTEPKSIRYGIERGYKLKQYDLCDDYEFVPSTILRQYCDENLLVEYLEKLTHFTA